MRARYLITLLLVLFNHGALADATKLIAQAEQIHHEASALNHGWIATTRWLTTARQALNAGQEAQAEQAAERALGLARASLDQAKREQKAWQKRQLVP